MPSLARSRRAQGSPEFIVVVSFVAMVFLIALLIGFQRQAESHGLQVFLDAKSVVRTVAGNIDMISKNGDGYHRFFSIPERLYGFTDYEITVYGNFVGIAYGGETWSASILTSNVSVLRLEKGESHQNCVANVDGEVVISDQCGLSDRGCGTVRDCGGACADCYDPEPGVLNQNSLSRCASYGCSDGEWHFYRLVPDRSGTLEVAFTGNGTMSGGNRTDLLFYDYTGSGCSSPETVSDLEPSTRHGFSVQAGSTYVIGLDVDSGSCGCGCRYELKTELT